MKSERNKSAVFGKTLFVIWENRWYFLAPLFIALVLLALAVYFAGPDWVTSFIYAGA